MKSVSFESVRPSWLRASQLSFQPRWLIAAGWQAMLTVVWLPVLLWAVFPIAHALVPEARSLGATLAWSGVTLTTMLWLASKLRLFEVRERRATKAPEIPNHRILVIGAGPVGLAAIKELRAEDLDVTCYESSDGIGGVFRYQPTAPGGVSRGTKLTSSPWVTAYSDFPPSSSSDAHWMHDEYLAYLERYADHFSLTDAIRFHHEVESVEDLGARWRVRVSDLAEGTTRVEYFDRVVVCAGLNLVPKPITTPGHETFEGTTLHASEYDSAQLCKGKRVMVVGLGESAVDIANEVSRVAKSTHVSMRRGRFLIPRVNPLNGRANDYDTNRLRYATPTCVQNWFMLTKRRVCAALGHMDARTKLRHELLEASNRGPMSQAATKADDFLEAVVDTRISLCGSLRELTSQAAVLDDGTQLEIDVIIYAHGYEPRWPFLRVSQETGACHPGNLYLRMFHPHYGQRLAFLGYARPAVGAIPPTGELQARYLAQLSSGQAVLPSASEMQDIINTDAEHFARTFPGVPSTSPLVSWIPYLDRLAALTGACPNPWMLLRNPTLMWKVMSGPMTGAIYRLSGPGAAPAIARETVSQLPRMQPLPELLTMSLLHIYCDLAGFVLGRRDLCSSHSII